MRDSQLPMDRLATRLAMLALGLSILGGCGDSQPPRPVAAVETGDATQAQKPNGGDALALFERRILPILQAERPSSCSECHLSGVDLKDYIHPDQRQTFASLVRAGLVDIETPDRSKLLEFIARRPETPSLITEKVRQEEYDAFRAWLRAAAADPRLLATKPDDLPVGPAVPEEVIRHARTDRVLASFVENVWNEVGRCAACHSPDRNQEQVRKHSEQVSWITLDDPAATMQYMLDAGLIDTETPAQSLILMKPTLQVEHGGGQKMLVGDRTYKQFRRFIDDYAAVVAGRYTSVDQLPEASPEVSIATEIWLKIEGVPAEFDRKLLQADLYRWETDHWSDVRWATSDRAVFGKGNLWQHSLSLTAPRDAPRADEMFRERTLPPGRYLVRILIDDEGRLARDAQAELGREDVVGEVEVESAWPEGYGNMTVIRYPGR